MNKFWKIIDKIKINPLTLAFIIFSILFGQGKPIFFYFIISIIHELSHLLYPNHSKDFWRIVEKYCPNYKKLRKQLREM